ncbi:MULTISPECIES: C40 family peptidase [unclassified Streptomyces]|uniref:C40 family peptidase n=1 Tax=unclassified Streptomyces TaxID=2593676 RepID=UPI000DABA6A5|nr:MULTISPECIES: C40 family peptidase [unclassified Streptomyces]PZT75962.1 glycoside hydrolase [Streptomyces sp. AC1-42W]PZT80087.1 glycoside hydrolase [Streptomyces sp. AC1-42T]
MSHTALIPSHRKPRRNASTTALRAGVAGGVLSTIAVAGAAGPAQAEPVTQTIEMPTITAGLSTTAAASAAATQQVAQDLATQAQEDAAAAGAAKDAKKAKAEAVRKAEAKKKAEAAAKAKAEATERASRAAARTTLQSTSGSSSSGSTATTTTSTSTTSTSSRATGSAASVVAFAQAQVGDAYVSGGTGPNSWDCSGLVQAAFRTVGVDLPRISQSQSTFGTQVGLGNLQPGDILYWGSAGSAYHVGIYVGGGQFVGAQNSSTGVVQRPLSYDPPTGAVRVL